MIKSEGSQRTQNTRRLHKDEIDKLTMEIIGIAIKVHKILGPGFVEKVYEKVLAYEFKRGKINFINQAIIQVKYEDLEIGEQRVDFIIERVGLILNFGKKTLEIKRMVYI